MSHWILRCAQNDKQRTLFGALSAGGEKGGRSCGSATEAGLKEGRFPSARFTGGPAAVGNCRSVHSHWVRCPEACFGLVVAGLDEAGTGVGDPGYTQRFVQIPRGCSPLILILSVGWLLFATKSFADDAAPPKWLQSTAYVIPKYTATEGEGYFAIIEGLNRRLYIGTHANGVNSWLVEFDPAAEPSVHRP